MKASFISIVILLCVSCHTISPEKEDVLAESAENWVSRVSYSLGPLPDFHLTELQPCDILVKPNLDWLPGSTKVPGGFGFGHAAIVIRGASDTNEANLLRKVLTFESQARDVPGEYQVRQVAAYAPGNDFRYANYNFRPEYLGRYYRLRIALTIEQREAIIAFLLKHDGDLSSPRAWKDYHNLRYEEVHIMDKQSEYWYCSLIIWQAFHDVLGIDLDANQGLYIYPNDLINSPYFDGKPGEGGNRVRF